MSRQSVKKEMLDLMNSKLPLVQKDYESYFYANSRNIDRINQIRNIEVTLLSAISVVLITQQSFPITLLVSIYILILIFYLYNVLIRSVKVLTGEEVLELEKKLQVTSFVEYVNNIVNWEFGNTIASKRTPSKRFRAFLKTLFSQEILMWHGGLATAITVLYIAV
ncbi:MAG: hypothetical protein EDM79_09955, partial [Chloroflexi bacterium]